MIDIFKIPEILPVEEFLEVIYEDDTTRIERIISSGQSSHWYDQDESEYVILLQGSAILEFEDTEIELTKGSGLHIPAHKKHRVKYTSEEPKCIWICIFSKKT